MKKVPFFSNIGRVRLDHIVCLILPAILCVAAACSQGDLPSVDETLLRVGDRKVSVYEFERVFEIARVAYPPTSDGDPEILEVIRHRLLVEMIEELLISLRAKELGISVSEEELDARVAEIRQDYPEETFDQIFIEQAVPFDLWKKRIGLRMLLDKVIAVDMADHSPPTLPPAATVGTALPDALANGGTGGDESQRENDLHGGGDGGYADWIARLAKKYPVEINTALWKTLYGP